MKDFAKSIYVGNASGTKEFNTEADLRRWCIEHQYAYTPTHGGYYRLEDDKPGRNRPDLYAHVKAGNSKVGNSSHTKEEAKTKDEYFKILKFYQTQGYKTKAGEYNPNGRIKLHKGDDSVEIVLVGNSKVGNASGAYNKLETEIRYAISEASVASKILSGNFSATNIISALSHCKQCCDNAIKLAQEYDREMNK